MESNENCVKCNPPEACLIACPNNRLLHRMPSPICSTLLDLLADPDAELEIVVRDVSTNPENKERSQS